ncbi:exportin-T-like isoform X3 [Silene latifolia]|uniref:exportin-T-like isoform X3 n=1 Tax=Silene latifolia TaxID=37657 RepID=UPI003D77AE50
MYEKYGENFVAQFVSKSFLAAHCPPDLAQQYHQKLQFRDLVLCSSNYDSRICEEYKDICGCLVNKPELSRLDNNVDSWILHRCKVFL